MKRFEISILAGLIVMAAGFSLRFIGPSIGVPLLVVKYGGSILWSAMIYCVISVVLPRSTINRIAAVSALVCLCVEIFRLYHSPWLESFRLTLAGQLLLGRIFSLWNLVAYGVGISAAMLIHRFFEHKKTHHATKIG